MNGRGKDGNGGGDFTNANLTDLDARSSAQPLAPYKCHHKQQLHGRVQAPSRDATAADGSGSYQNISSITRHELIASFQVRSEARALQMPCPLSRDARAAAADRLER